MWRGTWYVRECGVGHGTCGNVTREWFAAQEVHAHNKGAKGEAERR